MAQASPCYVYNERMLMRVRLLCGLYSRRAVPPRWRPLARAYCIAMPVFITFIIYSSRRIGANPASTILLLPYAIYYIYVFVSLWTGDEYMYNFFIQDRLTDITLDSPRIFYCLHKKIKRGCIYLLLFHALRIGMYVAVYYNRVLVVLCIIIPTTIIDMIMTIGSSSKLLVVALFESRLLVLKRRLQRYGFRSTGRARTQRYCEIYHQIMQGVDDMDNPLKLLILLDWISSCCKIIYIHVYYLSTIEWTEHASIQVMIFVITAAFVLTWSFGHVALLESAAAHCEDMAVFSATQLIKTPTEEERRRILTFLAALEQRGARYRVLRALPLNARLVLGALGMCSAQIIVFIGTIDY